MTNHNPKQTVKTVSFKSGSFKSGWW